MIIIQERFYEWCCATTKVIFLKHISDYASWTIYTFQEPSMGLEDLQSSHILDMGHKSLTLILE